MVQAELGPSSTARCLQKLQSGPCPLSGHLSTPRLPPPAIGVSHFAGPASGPPAGKDQVSGPIWLLQELSCPQRRKGFTLFLSLPVRTPPPLPSPPVWEEHRGILRGYPYLVEDSHVPYTLCVVTLDLGNHSHDPLWPLCGSICG